MLVGTTETLPAEEGPVVTTRRQGTARRRTTARLHESQRKERQEREEDMSDSLYLLDRRDCDSSVMRDTQSSRVRSVNVTYSSSQSVVKKQKRGDARDTGDLRSKVVMFKEKVRRGKERLGTVRRTQGY